MKLAVTGATGYIGQRLVARARAEGHDIVALTRRPPARVDITWKAFDLSEPVPITLPEDVDAVVHLAAHIGPRETAPKELEAAHRLIGAAQVVGARLVFVSSQTARPDAPTAYGRVKWQIEQAVVEARGWVVRSGLVYGGLPSGLYGVLVRSVAGLPALPALLPPPFVQPVHIDDLVTALLRGMLSCNGVTCVGAADPVSFNRFLRSVARERVRRWRPRVPVPAVAIRWLHAVLSLRTSERLGLARLVSLIDLQQMNSRTDLDMLGLELRPLDTAFTSDRRRLLAEARALLTYVLRSQPDSLLLRRYVRCVEELRGGRPLTLPCITTRSPFALAVLEHAVARAASGGGELRWRLDAAMALAEASPQGSARFLGAGEQARPFADALQIIRALIVDLAARGTAILLAPLMRVPARKAAFPE